jgi:hypothetical protein
MSKDMKYMHSNLTRSHMATMYNDAMSCYDRSVASMALMISHNFGVPEEIFRTVGETLRTMQFGLRAAMVDSTEFACIQSIHQSMEWDKEGQLVHPSGCL